jgi:hypothetical protein
MRNISSYRRKDQFQTRFGDRNSFQHSFCQRTNNNNLKNLKKIEILKIDITIMLGLCLTLFLDKPKQAREGKVPTF